MVGRAFQGDPGIAFILQLPAQGIDQAGLADAGLTADKNNLSNARLALLPGPPQQRQLGFAADETGERARVGSLEPTLRRALAEHPPDRHRLGKPLEQVGPNILEVESFADQQACCGADHHLTRFRQTLQSGR